MNGQRQLGGQRKTGVLPVREPRRRRGGKDGRERRGYLNVSIRTSYIKLEWVLRKRSDTAAVSP